MKNILISILLLASAGAYADSAADSQLRDAAAKSSLTRAEVKADYYAAKSAAKSAATQFALSDGPAIQSEPTSSERSRAEVRVEAIKEARAFRTNAQLF